MNHDHESLYLFFSLHKLHSGSHCVGLSMLIGEFGVDERVSANRSFVRCRSQLALDRVKMFHTDALSLT